MDRREFLASAGMMAALAASPLASQQAATEAETPDGFPDNVLRNDAPYAEREPIDGYHNAPAAAYEAFEDMKFGARIHWGIYSIWHRGAESWPFLQMTFEERQAYNQLYKTWNPVGFDAANWIGTFKEAGMKMFAFTTKHHEGFSMFDTKTRVRSRTNWTAPGGPAMESCDLAYSMMETPFRRDVVKELCHEAHRRGIKIDLYFSHPDWYDADFRPYGQHPLQVPSSAALMVPRDYNAAQRALHKVVVADPSPAEVKRMMERHRAQMLELVTNYGEIDMMCLDILLGPTVWPELRKTIEMVRKAQPNVMLRDRGIGNYGDYYTPERVVPGAKVATRKPWFCIYPLGTNFSYEEDAAKHKGTKWIVDTLVDTVAKGGGLMVGIGPNANGEFHPEAVRQVKESGKWLAVNGEAIYATRARDGVLFAEGDSVRFTRSKDRRWTYAVLTEWPGSEIALTSVKPREGTEIRMLGSAKPLAWRADGTRGTVIRLPENMQTETNRPCSYAWTLRMEA